MSVSSKHCYCYFFHTKLPQTIRVSVGYFTTHVLPRVSCCDVAISIAFNYSHAVTRSLYSARYGFTARVNIGAMPTLTRMVCGNLVWKK